MLKILATIFVLGLSVDLVAQAFIREDKRFVGEDRYHHTKGWINSLSFHSGGFVKHLVEYATPPLSTQIEYKGYKLINPNLGLGGGIAHKTLTTRELDYESHDQYKFLDVFIYGRGYADMNRRRMYADIRIGYGFVIDDKIRNACSHCNIPLPLDYRYSSVIMLQPGIGVEFATKRKFRWGLNWGLAVNNINVVKEVYPDDGIIPADGLATSSYNQTVVKPLLGISFYL